ncbi:MAG TPA: DUF6441 family protein [Alphaproteobacteria bacterium]|nr:DUF6441 family protein [Alphaproteobacteria bacterium]
MTFKLRAAVRGDLKRLVVSELKAGEQAVTAAMREAADGLKGELRGQVEGAGLGRRLANTWRSQVFPRSGVSLRAAGFVFSKAPTLARVFDEGATIRSRDGFFLAIPLPAAGHPRITPAEFESNTGIPLRFVYRRGRPSLLVAEHARVDRRGQARANRTRRRDGTTFSRLTGRAAVPVFVLLPQVTLRKRLDIAGAASRWIARVPALVAAQWRRFAGE